jgi:hypothetical protein
MRKAKCKKIWIEHFTSNNVMLRQLMLVRILQWSSQIPNIH